MQRCVFWLLVLLLIGAPAAAQGGPGTADFPIRDFGACINLPDFTVESEPDAFNTVFDVPGLFAINFAEYLLPLDTIPASGDAIYGAMISLLDTVGAAGYARVPFEHPQYVSAVVEFTLDGRRLFGMIYRNHDDRLFFLFADKVADFDMLAIGRAIFAADAACTPLAGAAFPAADSAPVDDVGRPAEPFPYPMDYIPPGFLAYNETDHVVFSRVLQGRPVTVAFRRDVPLTFQQQESLASYVFEVYGQHWNVFGGFLWPSYTLVISNDPITSPEGEPGIGWEFDASHFTQQTDYEEYIAHGMFHAWWGHGVEDASQHTNPTTPEIWSSEGITQYYGVRAGSRYTYRHWMASHWRYYQQMQGTGYDVPLIQMQAYAHHTGDPQFNFNAYWKGALVAYLIDRRLIEAGLNLDHLLRYMYDNYGLARIRYTTDDMQNALQTLTGQDWGDFFARYIYGTEPLPPDGTFEFLAH